MESVFDSNEFNDSMFVRRKESSPCPPGAEDFHVAVAPGVTLHARAYWAPAARATFIVFHGNGEIVADYDALAPRYRDDVNAHVIVIDYRGYGQSSGSPTFRTCIEDTFPALRALKLAAEKQLVEPCITLGRSLGGACAAELAGIQQPPVHAIVLESAPAEWRGIVRRRNLTPPLELTPEEQAVFDPGRKLERCQIPALVLHGDEDTTIRPYEARTNFHRLRHPASRLVFIPGRHHGDVLYDPLYYQTLSEFVEMLRDPNLNEVSTRTSSRSSVAMSFLDGLERRAEELGSYATSSNPRGLSRFLSKRGSQVVRGLRRIARHLSHES